MGIARPLGSQKNFTWVKSNQKDTWVTVSVRCMCNAARMYIKTRMYAINTAK